MHEKIHKFCIQVFGIEILVERWGQITKIFIDKIYSYIFIYGNISSQKTYFPDISEIQRIGCRSLKLMNANFLLSNSENYSCNLHTSIWCFMRSYWTHGVGRWRDRGRSGIEKYPVLEQCRLDFRWRDLLWLLPNERIVYPLSWAFLWLAWSTEIVLAEWININTTYPTLIDETSSRNYVFYRKLSKK